MYKKNIRYIIIPDIICIGLSKMEVVQLSVKGLLLTEPTLSSFYSITTYGNLDFRNKLMDYHLV